MKYWSVVAVVCFFLFQSFASGAIAIKGNHLRAPEGSDYVWFLDGGVLSGEEGQQLEVEKNGTYLVTYRDKSGSTRRSTVAVVRTKEGVRRIYLIGDSTVQNYPSSSYPMTGWGQVLGHFFDAEKVAISNRAIGGRSSRTFHEQGRWESVKNELNVGDFVFIQFGHNDRSSNPDRHTDTAQYKNYLEIYVKETRALGATPVLVSPMVMHSFQPDTLYNRFREGRNDYRGAMLEVANKLQAPFIDLNLRSYEYVRSVGEQLAADYLFMKFPAGVYSNYPKGLNDGTHFQEMGALAMARLVSDGVADLVGFEEINYLKEALMPTYQIEFSLTPTHLGYVIPSFEAPKGARVTRRAILNSDIGYTFMRWEDGAGTTVSEGQKIETFTMEGYDQAYSAIVADCMGVESGSSLFDNCFNCLTDTLLAPPCANRVESENACEASGIVDQQMEYGVENQFTIFLAGKTGLIHYPVHSSTGGNTSFGLKFKGDMDSQLADVYVNGALQVSGINLASTQEWAIVYFNLDIQKGKNTISIVFPNLKNLLAVDMLMTYRESELMATSCSLDLDEFEAGLVLQAANNSAPALFPNPFRNSLTIQTSGKLSYQVLTMSGVAVYSGTCRDRCVIGNELPVGSYLIKVTTATRVYSYLIVKQ
ncbi:SGNH/GDSL hydrolase family protein [Marinoscillum furvescens]|uniref:Putative secreted protein (Por secretion system target) n=1 Tax=Marinoscillum furvescens DSM 4134 TaxID=1122208 RepID=A0A3D9LJS9_MARFU|nr:SGNH/GDSL hydrolase family protein [Marinoscillum furvescens]REE05512.1 putative secreted protein (Por secretion system target) [Marinoscillum furvescens DSM 4134]